LDPLSLALISFTALKKGIALGKDISSMGKDLNKVFDFIDGTKAAQKSGNKNDPLSDYIAYEKALDMEKQLEQVIWETRGSKGVATFKRMRAQATERDRQSKYSAVARKNRILNVLSILLGLTITLGGGAVLIWAAIEFKP
tara:strand:+ start:61 stop:483 length:423 start_codon:yes stop_codon:yes gene_type:complete